MTDEAFMSILSQRDDFVHEAARRLLLQPAVSVNGLTPSKIPTMPGVYVFYDDKSSRPFHIGESMNLRKRIYQSQLRGQSDKSPLKRKVKKQIGLEGFEARDYIFPHFSVGFMPLSLGRIEVEDYLNAQFGIVESRPDAQPQKI